MRILRNSITIEFDYCFILLEDFLNDKINRTFHKTLKLNIY